jgi:methylmalonyl-CoA/ethylmalonyl-CoA epimerase
LDIDHPPILGSAPVRTILDHVALAVQRWADAWPRLGLALGGRWVAHGYGPGFAPAQIAFADGRRVELIQPHDVARNDFLRRFLDHSGPGPHHLTYKVDDIDAALRELDDFGLRPVAVDLFDPAWKEAFLHPRDAALGVVVQLAQSQEPRDGAPREPVRRPAELREPTVAAASLLHVAHVVADLAHARRVFRDLLGGEEAGEGRDEAATWVELAWPQSMRLRLLHPVDGTGPLAAWLDGRPGRVHHLAFACPDPAGVPGAVRLAGEAWELPPDPATGTRFVLVPQG